MVKVTTPDMNSQRNSIEKIAYKVKSCHFKCCSLLAPFNYFYLKTTRDGSNLVDTNAGRKTSKEKKTSKIRFEIKILNFGC